MNQQVAVRGTKPFTYEDYLRLPDDGRRWEVIRGELLMTPAPIVVHQRILRNLGWVLVAYVEDRGTGEVLYAPMDVVLSQTVVVEPDILYISRERSRVIAEKNIQGAPDLAVEILSSSTKARDRKVKWELYAEYGVREYWIVDPEARTVEVSVLEEGKYRLYAQYGEGDMLTSPMFPDLEIELARVFASPNYAR